MRRIVLRADGSNLMGLGHIYRSVALLEMLSDNFYTVFITKCHDDSIRELLSTVVDEIVLIPSGTLVGDEISMVRDLLQEETDIVVLDGYHFDEQYQHSIRHLDCRLICVDDVHNTKFVADAVINHGAGATSSDYRREAHTFLFLGLGFSLVRKFFFECRNRIGNDEIFLCLGGADPHNETAKVVLKLAANKERRPIHIVLGAAYRHADTLQETYLDTDLNISVHHNLSPQKMAALMSKCNTAITSPSTVAYEYLATGGELYLEKIADNQAMIYQALCAAGIAAPFSNFSMRQQNGSIANRSEFTIPYAKRNIQTIFDSLSMKCALAEDADTTFVYEIASDPLTRSQSYHSSEIALDDHIKWMTKKIRNTNCLFYVVSLFSKRIGQIRFDIANGIATISFSVHPDFRGLRYSYGILIAGVRAAVLSGKNISRFEGFVKNKNIASQKALEFASFAKRPAIDYVDSSIFTRVVT